MPLVSVIIPAFNAEKFISATLNSLIDQTYTNWEAIIVNDGATDNTEFVIHSFVEKDKRFKIISQENSGCSSAKNTGLSIAKGECIQYLDADDLLSPTKLESQVQVLLKNQYAVAVCKTKIFSTNINENDLVELDSDFLYDTQNTIEFLLNLYGLGGRRGMIQPNAFLISKKMSDKIGVWNTEISPSPDEDGEYFCRALTEASEVKVTEGINYYRKMESESSLSKKKGIEYAWGALKTIKKKFDCLRAHNDSEIVRKLYAENLVSCYYSYGFLYNELYKWILEEIQSIGFRSIPVSGIGRFNQIARIIGFKSAIKLKRLLYKV